MNINKKDLVTISHFSGSKPIKTYVINLEEARISLKLTKEFLEASIIVGDPIVMVYEKCGEVYTCECFVDSILPIEQIVIIQIDNKQSIKNVRLFERFPVCIYAGIRFDDDNKSGNAIIKNLSISGLAINTKKNIKVGSEIELDVYLDERIIFFKTKVAWKKKVLNNFEYGLKAIYQDFSVKNTIRLYLSILKKEQEDWIIQRIR